MTKRINNTNINSNTVDKCQLNNLRPTIWFFKIMSSAID